MRNMWRMRVPWIGMLILRSLQGLSVLLMLRMGMLMMRIMLEKRIMLIWSIDMLGSCRFLVK